MDQILHFNSPSNHGWICPVCGRVNAPWVAQCFCNHEDIKVSPCTYCFHNVHVPHDGTGVPCDSCPATAVE